jgi:hypothetical protein
MVDWGWEVVQAVVWARVLVTWQTWAPGAEQSVLPPTLFLKKRF